MAAYPNPLQVVIGTDILISHFRNEDGGRGILLQNTGVPHTEGELGPEPELPHKPTEGEIYLIFPTAASAVVFLEALSDTLISLMGMPERKTKGA